METKTFYGVEYKSAGDGQTFDIFPTLKEAKLFSKSIVSFGKEYNPLYIFKAEFNRQNVFKENNQWNYDDYPDTIIRCHKYYKTISN